MKKILVLFVLLLPLLACQKDKDVIVEYVISDNASGFLVNYINENGVMISDAVLNNDNNTWSYSFQSEKGKNVFISAISIEANDGIKVSLIVDGKTLKHGSSNNDTTNYVTVSGTIPYN